MRVQVQVNTQVYVGRPDQRQHRHKWVVVDSMSESGSSQIQWK